MQQHCHHRRRNERFLPGCHWNPLSESPNDPSRVFISMIRPEALEKRVHAVVVVEVPVREGWVGEEEGVVLQDECRTGRREMSQGVVKDVERSSRD